MNDGHDLIKTIAIMIIQTIVICLYVEMPDMHIWFRNTAIRNLKTVRTSVATNSTLPVDIISLLS